MFKIIIFGLLASTLASAASNATMRSEAEFDRFKRYCVENGGGTLGSISLCVKDADKVAGRKLTKTYQKLLEELGTGKAADQLRKSQRSWLAYQESFCSMIGLANEAQGASVVLIVEADCLLRTTIEREGDLDQVIKSLQ